jgi:hypothetical protein
MESKSSLPYSQKPETSPCPDPDELFNFNLFSVHLIHRGYDPSDMELVNTEIRSQI